MSQPLSAPAPQTLIVLPSGAREYLGRIGISVDSIRNAVEQGEARAMENTHAAYPKTAAGLSRWIETVGTLRRNLMHEDWKSENPLLRPIVVNPERTIFLGVLGGTDATGTPNPSRDRRHSAARVLRRNKP